MVHFLSVHFPMDWYKTDSKSKIKREIHTEKETPELHNKESENISGESIGGAALIWGRHLLIFLFQMRHLFEGGTYYTVFEFYGYLYPSLPSWYQNIPMSPTLGTSCSNAFLMVLSLSITIIFLWHPCYHLFNKIFISLLDDDCYDCYIHCNF